MVRLNSTMFTASFINLHLGYNKNGGLNHCGSVISRQNRPIPVKVKLSFSSHHATFSPTDLTTSSPKQIHADMKQQEMLDVLHCSLVSSSTLFGGQRKQN